MLCTLYSRIFYATHKKLYNKISVKRLFYSRIFIIFKCVALKYNKIVQLIKPPVLLILESLLFSLCENNKIVQSDNFTL